MEVASILPWELQSDEVVFNMHLYSAGVTNMVLRARDALKIAQFAPFFSYSRLNCKGLSSKRLNTEVTALHPAPTMHPEQQSLSTTALGSGKLLLPMSSSP